MRRSGVLFTLATVVVSLVTAAAPAPAQVPSAVSNGRPNVVVIMTDDQRADSMWAMPKTRALLGDRGTTFTNSFVSYALCCPSRSTFVTGQYSHNHGVESNKWPEGGFWKLDHTDTLATWLDTAGYDTAHVGKYLNGYGRPYPGDGDPPAWAGDAQDDDGWARVVPPGWDDWQGLVDPTTYRMYGYVINDNGTLVTYGDTEDDYQTDVLAERAVETLREHEGDGDPFFLSVAPLAPHSESAAGDLPPGPRAAPRHEGVFDDLPFVPADSYDEADVSDKPAVVQRLPRIGPAADSRIVQHYRDRLESLLAVDDLVESIWWELARQDLLDETVIVFTSDNGYFHGEHRIRSGKVYVYEEAVQVPLIVSGAGFPRGHEADQLVANIDLAATIADVTGVAPGRVLDGRSLRPPARDATLGRARRLLLEAGPVGRRDLAYDAVRTNRYVYVEYSNGDEELYDLEQDPAQLDSRHDDPYYAARRLILKAQLAVLKDCAGTTCSRGT